MRVLQYEAYDTEVIFDIGDMVRIIHNNNTYHYIVTKCPLDGSYYLANVNGHQRWGGMYYSMSGLLKEINTDIRRMTIKVTVFKQGEYVIKIVKQ